jgi:predicted RNA-binding protein
MEPTYWLDLFTGTTWKEFLDHGGQVSGFRESRWNTVKRVKPGDLLVCYLTGVQRWVGILKVVSEAYKDASSLWKAEVFPSRLRVEPLVTLTPETAVPMWRSSGTSWLRPSGEALFGAHQPAFRHSMG